MLRFVLSAVLAAGSLQAAETSTCDNFDANASNVDWTQPTRTYANGAIRLIKIDIEEPACCAVFLMVLYPVGDDPFLSCTLVGRSRGFGFGDLDLHAARSRYDAQTGLSIIVPVQSFDGEHFLAEDLQVTINQSLGSVLVK